MTYEKPEVTLVASATEAVRGDKDSSNVDGPIGTAAAYQADE